MRELKNKDVVRAVKVGTDLNVADLLTKCHEHKSMDRLLKIMNLDKLSEPES